jgi:lantibiotic leader peptide-processing serine protease
MRLARLQTCCALVVVLGMVACQSDSPTAPLATPAKISALSASKSPTYLVSIGASAPADLAARLEKAGGRIKKLSRKAGVAAVESDAADFASRVRTIAGVEGVGRDRVVQWVDPSERAVSADFLANDHQSNETFANLQWNLLAVQAPEAWHAGYTGQGVRVAVLDGGLNPTHIDLAGSVDVACSASMVEGFNFNQDVAGFSHATHVSGIIAARDNGVGTIGIAPGATIIGVKVLQNGTGSFEDVIEGILYAADPAADPAHAGCARADIINMSLGDTFIPTSEDRELIKALDKATTFAYQHGVTVIASAGNDATYHDKGSPWVTVPAQSRDVISVSATGPVGFAVGYPNGATNFSEPASYTNFGKSVVTLGAPGGNDELPGNALCSIPRIPVGAVTTACFVFDFVISPGTLGPNNTGYFFAEGTSMAAPATAAIAALIIQKNAGSMSPAQVKARLQQSAADLGKPGEDEFYGKGFVNALRAVR